MIGVYNFPEKNLKIIIRNYHAGSFFFHTHMNSKPNDRDIMKAKALVADIVEDYLYSCDVLRKEEIFSQYISIS